MKGLAATATSYDGSASTRMAGERNQRRYLSMRDAPSAYGMWVLASRASRSGSSR